MPVRKSAPKRPNFRRKLNRKRSFATAVKKVISRTAEPKSHTVFTTETAGNTNTAVQAYSMNSVAQGSTGQTRNGKYIYQKFIDIRGHINASYQYPIYHKFILLTQDAQSDPTVDLFEINSGQYGPAAGNISDIYGRLNTSKYRILATRVVKTGTVSNTANDANSAKMFKMSVKCPSQLQFEIGGTNPQHKWMRLLVFSRRADNDTTLGEATELTFNAKLYFNDV